MDNREYHPHVVPNDISDYKRDHYTTDKDLRHMNDEGCGCIFLLSFLFFISFLTLGAIMSLNNPDFKAKQESAKREAIEAFIADSVKHAKDSIARYEYVYDSVITALHVRDSINRALEEQKKTRITFTAFIDDGVTSREVNVVSEGDSLPIASIRLLGQSFNKLAFTAAVERQDEIDNNKEYYTRFVTGEDN